MRNLVYFTTLFLMIHAETCIRLLNNREENRVLKRSPGRIWRWDTSNQDFVLVEALKSNNRLLCSVDFAKDLRGKSIVVAADHMNPYIIINANQTGVTGFIGDVWTTLEETLKFTTIYRRATQSAGWTLMNGRAHALLEATVIYSYTSGYYTYSVPITSNYYALFVQSEGTRVSTWWYASIFSPILWLIIGLFIMIIVFIIIGIHSLRKILCKSYIECDDELSSLSFVLLFVLGGISGQGCQKIPLSWSLRLTILSFLIMGMLLSCGFSSTLTSYLTIGVTFVPITSLEDVAQKRTHSLCVRNDSSAYIHFTMNGLRGEELMPEWKDLVNKDCPDFRDLITFSSKLCRPGFVYLEGPDIFLSIYRQVRDQCRYIKLPHAYWRLKLAFQHARASEYRKVIDAYLMRLRSVGILDYLEKKWFTKERDNALGQLQWSDFRAVEYDHIRVVFLMLSIAVAFSALICVLENIVYRLQICSQQKSCTTVTEDDNSNINYTFAEACRHSLSYQHRRKPRIFVKEKGKSFLWKVDRKNSPTYRRLLLLAFSCTETVTRYLPQTRYKDKPIILWDFVSLVLQYRSCKKSDVFLRPLRYGAERLGIIFNSII